MQSLLHVPSIKTDFGSRAFSSAAPQIWNHTPTAIRVSPHHHLTPSNITSKLTISTSTLPHRNSHNLALPRTPDLIFSARQHTRYSALYAIVRPSVCLSVTRVDQPKTVEVRITQLSPQSSHMTLVSSWLISPRNSKGNLGSGDAK